MKASIASKKISSIYSDSIVIKTSQISYRVSANNSFGLAVVVGRRLGPALKRNLFKRRIRALYNDFLIKKDKKITMIILPKTINLGWIDIKNSFELMLKKTNDI